MRIRIGAGSSEIVEIDEIESSNDVFGFGSTVIIFRWVFIVVFCEKKYKFCGRKILGDRVLYRNRRARWARFDP